MKRICNTMTWRNCLWLFLPVIAFNMLFTRHLPEIYLVRIDHPAVVAEHIVRVVLMALSFLMVIDTKSRTGRTGIWIYATGLSIYFASWVVLLNNPSTDNPVVLLSGYWSATIWLVGIGLTGGKLWIGIRWRRWIYIVLSVLFGVTHTAHGYILLFR